LIINPTSDDYALSNYNYELSPELIAQSPAVPRDSSRLLVASSSTNHNHSVFRDLPNWLQPGDLLVLNNTKVIPARLYGRKSSGAEVEILLLEEKQPHCWLALVKPGKRFKLGTQIFFHSNKHSDLSLLKATVIDVDLATGGRVLQFDVPSHKSFWELLDLFGEVPLPPYIKDSDAQPSNYQTVYAEKAGAVAAPTAGLHFTEELFQRLTAKKIKQVYITLHVGVGTFRPVEVADITTHNMHQELIEVGETVVRAINETKAKGGRIIAVGTTVVRALEGAAKISEGEQLLPFSGKTDLFIYPGYRWRVIDGLITNFHLPCSSLLMLVSALIGRERLLNLYGEAIREKYRFYSFGDAMLILPQR
jgi:S-adenosylmethionine:tRNA ribosyltransferase-isomerase